MLREIFFFASSMAVIFASLMCSLSPRAAMTPSTSRIWRSCAVFWRTASYSPALMG